jgi:hypothetical protein
MAEGEEQPVSKYNSGINIIMRLDELWKKVNEYCAMGKYSKWNSYLDIVWRELARDLKENEFKTKEGEFDAFDTKITDIGTFGDAMGETFNKIKEDAIKNRNKMYKVLNKKELFLRRLENHLGKGTAWDDDDEDGFD